MHQAADSLSKRALKLAEAPARIDFELYKEASQNLYDPIERPNGKFLLNVAENDLMADIIREKLEKISRGNYIPPWVLKYTHSSGHADVRQQIARFMQRYLCDCPIEAEHLVLSAGASASLEICAFLLANPKDVVVIPAPSYPMYSHDMGVKSKLQRHDMPTFTELSTAGDHATVNTDFLDKTLAELEAAGKNFKILLLTTPDNPTGCLYSGDQLHSLAVWCIKHKVHLLVNEIYGLSLIDTSQSEIRKDYSQKVKRTSFANLMQIFNSDFLHLCYSFSKDFAASGLRMGLIYTLNSFFLKAAENLNIQHMVSNHTQWLLGKLVEDDSFVEFYIEENQKRLTRSYILVVSQLKKMGIPYIPARGSLFVWADFSRFLNPGKLVDETQLWLDIYEKTGVLLTPGNGFGHEKKGLFRIVYSAVPFTHLQVAMQRLKSYFT